MYKKMSILLMIVAIVGGSLAISCSDFLTGGILDTDPNRAVDVTVFQSFTAIQAAMFLNFTGHMARTTSIWMEQMSGTSRQYSSLGVYAITEQDHGGEMDAIYTAGGLIDTRLVINKSLEAGDRVFAGIGQVWEAYMMGMSASIWGDLPYSEAVSGVETPRLDDQADIYTAVQSLLDDAISNLSSGSGNGPGGNDFVYGGNASNWVALAHTLKARFYMHWAETDPSNYTRALSEAQLGIGSTDDNFRTLQTSTTTEANVWWQFNRDRDDYMRSGFYMVDLLKTRNDPRLTIYFGKDGDGAYSGSKPAENATSASNLSAAFLSRDHSSDLASWEETQFIIAESQFMTGNSSGARTTMNAALAGIETRYSLADSALSRYDDTVTGDELFEAIMMEKYIATFLNIEIYNDWKRTNMPSGLVGPGIVGSPIPRRVFYSSAERVTNPNIPLPNDQPLRNDNDPS